MAQSAEVDNTKMIALPVLFILTLILAAFITRKSLMSAVPRAKSDLRMGILFFGGIVCTILSIFLFCTAAWGYGVISALLSYSFALVCAPGQMEKHASSMFMASGAWFAIMLGIPNKWSTGIIAKVADCKSWFLSSEKQGDYCKQSWLTWSAICCIVIIIINFFTLLCLMSFAFDNALANSSKKVQSNTKDPNQMPLNQGDGDNQQQQQQNQNQNNMPSAVQ